jgi:bisanhydrobacterioruberin hydratase
MTNAGKLLKENKEMILILVIIIFYTVGTIGMLMPSYREQFLDLSFFNLLLSFSIVLLARKRRIQHFVLFLFLCFLTGMLAEWIGTKTGLLFGNYSYGDNLGPKISGVPLVIGINWGILVVSTASIIKRFKLNFWLSVVASALLMTFFDYLMEPVAIMSDYWSWNGEIPFYNYVCWFAVSLPLHYIYFRSDLVESNKVFDVLFLVMSVFFIILTLF